MPGETPRIPGLNIMMAKNGYIVSRQNDMNLGVQSEMYVARTLPELMRVIKQIATEARLCGNERTC